MSIKRFDGQVAFECDACDYTFETGLDDFSEALTSFKRNGGVVTKEHGEFFHFCSRDCATPGGR